MKQNRALVLMNMGGARNKGELELFLRNMFNDKNIISVKSDFLRSIIAAIIVWRRVDSAWENYEAIGGASPLNPLTQNLINKLQKELPHIYITQAMRYTPPMAQKCIKELTQKGIKEVTLLPLYPQFSTTTTKSSLEDFYKHVPKDMRCKKIKPFYKNSLYNQAVVDEIASKHKANQNLIFSAHGLPQKIVDKGDPYQKQLIKQVAIVKDLIQKRGLEFDSISLAYQSKVGPLQWLEPSLDSTLERFSDKKVLIYPISFIVDNSETDFELDIEYREIAQELHIKEYEVCRCVNDNDTFIEAIKDMIHE